MYHEIYNLKDKFIEQFFIYLNYLNIFAIENDK
jgi:hypothetical protein